MKENAIKKKVKEWCENNGYKVWFPIKSKWGKEKDIFGIFDGIAWRCSDMMFIQLTSMQNRCARVEKIANYMKKNRVSCNPPYTSAIVICWDDKKKCLRFFEVE